jgi:hypothetical protein
MNFQKKTEFDIDSTLNGDINIIKLIISLDKNKSENSKYFELLSKMINQYNQKYDNICACYEKSSIIKSVLTEELDIFNKLEYYTARVKSLENEVVNLNNKINSLSVCKPTNIDIIRSEVLEVFNKHASIKEVNTENEKNSKLTQIANSTNENNKLNVSKDNTSDIDYALVDKINDFIPDNADILLKHIVKEINGSAKGLSDFVSLFQKYGKVIETYNQIVYFQRKGCHFVKRVKL